MKTEKEFMLFKTLGKHNFPEEASHEQRSVLAPYSFHSPGWPTMNIYTEQLIEDLLLLKIISVNFTMLSSSSWNDCILVYFPLKQTSMPHRALPSGEYFGKLITVNDVFARMFF